MTKLSEQLEMLFSEWQDNIRKEVDRIEMDNMTKVDEIHAIRNIIRENENKLSAIENNVRAFATEMLKVARNVNSACDYAAHVVNTLDEIEGKEPYTHCDNCCGAIWNEDDIVCGEYGEYCCDECRAEAEDEEDKDENEE